MAADRVGEQERGGRRRLPLGEMTEARTIATAAETLRDRATAAVEIAGMLYYAIRNGDPVNAEERALALVGSEREMRAALREVRGALRELREWAIFS